MSRKQRPHPLVRALQSKLPDAVITVARQTDWYSMTFAGVRLELFLSLSGPDAAARMQGFADQLAEEEFALPRMLVADIAVIRLVTDPDSAILSVEALVLET